MVEVGFVLLILFVVAIVVGGVFLALWIAGVFKPKDQPGPPVLLLTIIDNLSAHTSTVTITSDGTNQIEQFQLLAGTSKQIANPNFTRPPADFQSLPVPTIKIRNSRLSTDRVINPQDTYIKITDCVGGFCIQSAQSDPPSACANCPNPPMPVPPAPIPPIPVGPPLLITNNIAKSVMVTITLNGSVIDSFPLIGGGKGGTINPTGPSGTAVISVITTQGLQETGTRNIYPSDRNFVLNELQGVQDYIICIHSLETPRQDTCPTPGRR